MTGLISPYALELPENININVNVVTWSPYYQIITLMDITQTKVKFEDNSEDDIQTDLGTKVINTGIGILYVAVTSNNNNSLFIVSSNINKDSGIITISADDVDRANITDRGEYDDTVVKIWW